tara:strand:- start:119 stop:259 length:141 start_codon:yes stop_codon:yes gene_type:complete
MHQDHQPHVLLCNGKAFHLISYARFTPDATGDLYAQANAAALKAIG